MLNLLHSKPQLHLFTPEPLSVTVLSRQEAEAQAPTFGFNDFVVSIGNPGQSELHFPCPVLHLHFFDKEDDRCITEEQADTLAAFVRKEIGLSCVQGKNRCDFLCRLICTKSTIKNRHF